MLLIGKALAEMMGTFAIIFVGVGSVFLSEKYPHLMSPWMIPVVWGVIIAAMIMTWSKISGAHFNPAVTLALAMANRLSIGQLAMYWASQLGGGLMAIGLLRILQK